MRHYTLQCLSADELKDLPKALLPLMQRYASDALFNFNAGHVALANGRFTLATYRFLNCAIRQRGDSEAWALAVASAMGEQDSTLMTLAITVGYFFVKEKLLVDLFRVMPLSTKSEAERDRLQRMIMYIVHTSPSLQPSVPLTVRVVGQDDTHVLEF